MHRRYGHCALIPTSPHTTRYTQAQLRAVLGLEGVLEVLCDGRKRVLSECGVCQDLLEVQRLSHAAVQQ